MYCLYSGVPCCSGLFNQRTNHSRNYLYYSCVCGFTRVLNMLESDAAPESGGRVMILGTRAVERFCWFFWCEGL